MHGQQFFKYAPQPGRFQRVRTVRLGFFGIIVDFEKNPIHARSYGCARQHGDKFGLAAARRRSIIVSVRGRR
jgi:hypothetical protein